MTTTDPTTAEVTALRERLAEAREQWRQVADALARAETERDQALAEIARLERAAHEQGADLWIAEDRLDRLRRQVLAVAEDLERYASDPRPARLPMSERKLAVALREIVVGEADRAQALAATAPQTAPTGRCGVCGHPIYPSGLCAYHCDDPETAPTAPQSDEQTQVRGESHTEHAGTVHDALHRIADHLGIPPWISPAATAELVIDEIDRLRELANEASELGITDTDQPATARVDLVIGLRQRGVPQHPDGPEAAALAEIDRLRAEVKRLSARVREWEAVNADLAARCDSGDIPIRLGERYSQAVLREIDRLRTERDRLMDELPEDNTIVAAIRRLRAALGSQEGSR